MRKFKTESQKLLDLMINSIYTNREIFLRELISNASDAVDKLYFRSLTDSEVQLTKSDLEIAVSFDKDARTITVSDTGIGMNADELEKSRERYLYIDHRHRGLGSNSCGPQPEAEYELPMGAFEWDFRISR